MTTAAEAPKLAKLTEITEGDVCMEKDAEELASSLSYEVIKELAPDELDLFEDIKEEFLRNPDGFSEKDPKKRKKMLGFAVPGLVEGFITVIVLPVVLDVVKKIVGKKIGEKTRRNRIRKLRDEAYNAAISLEMDEEKAALMADSLIGKLVQIGPE